MNHVASEACPIALIRPKCLATNGLQQVVPGSYAPVPMQLPRHASTTLRFTGCNKVLQW